MWIWTSQLKMFTKLKHIWISEIQNHLYNESREELLLTSINKIYIGICLSPKLNLYT